MELETPVGEHSRESYSPPLKRYRPQQYMLCVISDAGHRRIFSPDFEFHLTVPTSHDPHRWTTITLQQAEAEIEARLRSLTQEGKSHPTPKGWRHVIPQPSEKSVSIQVAAKLLGVSQATVRRTDSSLLPFSTTRGGHRRYSLEGIGTYLASIEKV